MSDLDAALVTGGGRGIGKEIMLSATIAEVHCEILKKMNKKIL
jgi:hypothetical protein